MQDSSSEIPGNENNTETQRGNTTKCENCGLVVPKSFSYCPDCGEKLAEQTKPSRYPIKAIVSIVLLIGAFIGWIFVQISKANAPTLFDYFSSSHTTIPPPTVKIDAQTWLSAQDRVVSHADINSVGAMNVKTAMTFFKEYSYSEISNVNSQPIILGELEGELEKDGWEYIKNIGALVDFSAEITDISRHAPESDFSTYYTDGQECLDLRINFHGGGSCHVYVIGVSMDSLTKGRNYDFHKAMLVGYMNDGDNQNMVFAAHSDFIAH